MKTLAYYLSAILTFGLLASHSQAGTHIDKDLSSKLSAIMEECEKIKPGMTRAALTNLFVLEPSPVTDGPIFRPGSEFREHQRFVKRQRYVYRRCPLIKIDVDFTPSDSKEARLTDAMAEISKPYLSFTLQD